MVKVYLILIHLNVNSHMGLVVAVLSSAALETKADCRGSNPGHTTRRMWDLG